MRRPVPLATVEMTKLGATKLRQPAQRTMELAEALYQSGFVSYPRTETDSFPATMDLAALVQLQTGHSEWGQYATGLLGGRMVLPPRNGGHDDQAHPPIHPLRAAERGAVPADQWPVYELITRHFLATVRGLSLSCMQLDRISILDLVR